MLLEHLFFCASMAVFLSKKLSLQTIHAIDGMKLLILLLIFVLSGLPSSLCAEEVIVDSLYWQNAEQKMEEEEYKDAARIYSEMIVLGDSLFRVYTGERVEDMRKDYTIDELELQNSAQQKRLYSSSSIFCSAFCQYKLSTITSSAQRDDGSPDKTNINSNISSFIPSIACIVCKDNFLERKTAIEAQKKRCSKSIKSLETSPLLNIAGSCLLNQVFSCHIGRLRFRW